MDNKKMSKIRELISKEFCNEGSDIQIVDDNKEFLGCDDGFSITYKDEPVEVFFLSKGDGYKFCHNGNRSEWENYGLIKIKDFDKYVDIEKNKNYIMKTLREIIDLKNLNS